LSPFFCFPGVPLLGVLCEPTFTQREELIALLLGHAIETVLLIPRSVCLFIRHQVPGLQRPEGRGAAFRQRRKIIRKIVRRRGLPSSRRHHRQDRVGRH
jgi:hypothetical protein